ncbi:hypothetical protein IEQ34_008568 [Dendrobium chrysotoxum]|uniref:Uncharacterized protein n=1 Tax=Dendrobium chrysotoxum TaxID=161865 RepID=A0AAV7GZA8_DENCH|nr:hypothetical protein IEQ34_008568 [Dendrobium chrysotoxum]
MPPAISGPGDGRPSREPPPSPIATGKVLSSAAVQDEILSVYLETSLKMGTSDDFSKSSQTVAPESKLAGNAETFDSNVDKEFDELDRILSECKELDNDAIDGLATENNTWIDSSSSFSCHGTRNMEAFNSRWPELPRNPKFFFDFLPKAMPIPPSGPTMQHNSSGLADKWKIIAISTHL